MAFEPSDRSRGAVTGDRAASRRCLRAHGRPPESLAVATFMPVVGNPRRRLSEQRRQLFFALEQRQAGDVLTVEFEVVEGEIDEALPPPSEACCISSNDITPSGRTPQSSMSEVKTFSFTSGSARAAATTD